MEIVQAYATKNRCYQVADVPDWALDSLQALAAESWTCPWT